MIIKEMAPLEEMAAKVRNARQSLGISQRRLAMLVGTSQSEIARIERDIERLNPSYKTMFDIIEVLSSYKGEGARPSEPKKAYEIMHKRVIYVKPGDTAMSAIRIMEENDFSQLPVLLGRKNVGTIYQKNVIEAMASGRISKRTTVRELLGPAMPQIDANTDISRIKPLLGEWNAILVAQNGLVVGIITVYDLLKLL